MTNLLTIAAALILLAQAADPRNSICTRVEARNPDGSVVWTSECAPPAEPEARQSASPS